MSNSLFKPNIKGFNDMRNMPGVQEACLEVAREIGSIASGQCGKAARCDVQPGKTRCHARATIDDATTWKTYGGKRRTAEYMSMSSAIRAKGGKVNGG